MNSNGDMTPEERRDLEELAVSRNAMFGLIRQSLDIEAELSTSPTWQYILHRVNEEKAQISRELADMGDRAGLNRLQARAIAVEMIPGWINELVVAARGAEHEIRIADGLPSTTD